MPGPVLVFDSGVGGLSVFDAIRIKLPALPISFACDNAGFPYGPREESDLIQRVETVIARLLERSQPSMIVIACNTASTLALEHLRARFSLPFVGVVPAIKPAAQISQNKVIGLLATPGTIKRAYTQKLIDDFASDCQIIRHGSTALVRMAEQRLRLQPIDLTLLKQELGVFEQAQPRPDTIVLACTHFPLLLEQLNTALSYPVRWVDSGEAIARRVEQLLPTLSPSDNKAFSVWMTADDENARQLWPSLQARGLTSLEFVQV